MSEICTLTTMAHTAGWHMIRLQGVTSRAFCILLYEAEATGRPPAELQHHHAVTSICDVCPGIRALEHLLRAPNSGAVQTHQLHVARWIAQGHQPLLTSVASVACTPAGQPAAD